MSSTDHRTHSDRILWRWVVGYEGRYLVSDQGQVMSVPFMPDEKHAKQKQSGMLVKPRDNGRGYLLVQLYKSKKAKAKYVHRLVAEAFIPNPCNKKEVNHLDGNRANNCVSNLEWVTSSENKLHASRVLGSGGNRRALTKEQVIAIRADQRTQQEIAEDYGIDQTNVSQIKLGKSYASFPGEIERRNHTRQRRLTSEQLKEIASKSGTYREIADAYGVSKSTVYRIKHGFTYQEV